MALTNYILTTSCSEFVATYISLAHKILCRLLALGKQFCDGHGILLNLKIVEIFLICGVVLKFAVFWFAVMHAVVVSRILMKC